MKRGIPISPGVAVAQAYCLDGVTPRPEAFYLDADSLSGEVARFEQACVEVARELEAVVARVSRQVGQEEAAIFHAHRMLLRDPTLLSRVKSAITQQRIDAATALRQTLDDYQTLFANLPDAYLRERFCDLEDVVGRLLAQLAGPEALPAVNLSGPLILVAREIFPSHTFSFDRDLVAGILTEGGGSTGHAAILARSLGIPAISGLRGLTREVRTGDLIALDGSEGVVCIKPGPEVEAAYRKLQREYVDLRGRLFENHDQPAVTPDHLEFELLANVNGPSDAALACRVGASGVGLYRTEYLFLSHPSVPDEEEQLVAYRAVIEASPQGTITIRTLDLGGDKQVPYLGQRQEANPFMGFRSTRLTTAYPDFFRTQLRAILRASCFGKVRLLFPMISTLEEVRRLKRIVQRICRDLERTGLTFEQPIPVGIMIEVPAAALCIDELLEEVDFISIGSNDLVQYLMAADRDNPEVAHLCDPFHPAFLRLLARVIQACNERNKPVTLCGEMAGWPRSFLPLFGMGLRRLSMSPAFVPSIKEVVRRSTLAEAERITHQVLHMHTAGAIRGFLARKTREIWPNVTLLDLTR
jgi:phosphotransferase system enzyme I (PtsI)